MHIIAPLIKDMAVMLGIASVVVILFQKIRQPVLLGYILSGVIIGPHTPPYILIRDKVDFDILSKLGVIFLMFCLGLEFSFHKLTRVGITAAVSGLFEVFFMLGFGLLATWLLGWSFNDQIFIAASLAISSTTIIIKAMEELGIRKQPFSELILGRLVIEDLLAILLLVGLPLLVTTQMDIYQNIAFAAIKLLVVAGGWFLIGYFLLPSFMRKVAPVVSYEVVTLVSVALCLLAACLAAYSGYSPALGAFIMGSILAETDLQSACRKVILPIRDIYAAIFFISVGMEIEPKVIIDHWREVLGLSILVILGKIIANTLGTLLTGRDISTALKTGFGMAQIGEFSFLITGLGATLNLINATLYPIIVSVSAVTTFTTPYLLKVSHLAAKAVECHIPAFIQRALRGYTLFIKYNVTTKKRDFGQWRYITRLLVNCVVTVVIFYLVSEWIVPLFTVFTQDSTTANSLGWILAFLLSSPFIWGMLFYFKFTRELSDVIKEVPLILKSIWLLGWLFTFTIVVTLSASFFDKNIIFPTFLSIMLITLLGFYARLGKIYYWFEQHLLHNLNSRSERPISLENSSLKRSGLAFITLRIGHSCIGKSLFELKLNKHFNLNLIAIYRGKNPIMIPVDSEILELGDKLLVLGYLKHVRALRAFYNER